jgi:hypothetical protein
MPGGGATGASAAGVPLTGIRSGGWLGSFPPSDNREKIWKTSMPATARRKINPEKAFP